MLLCFTQNRYYLLYALELTDFKIIYTLISSSMPIGFTSSCTADTVSPQNCTSCCTLVFPTQLGAHEYDTSYIAPMYSYLTTVFVNNLYITIFGSV